MIFQFYCDYEDIKQVDHHNNIIQYKILLLFVQTPKGFSIGLLKQVDDD